MKSARHVAVTGRVQGVFFRAWTRQEATRLGLSGWVRNRPDGSVEAHFEGEQAAVERMIALIHHGPPDARVERVDVREAELESGTSFAVRH